MHGKAERPRSHTTPAPRRSVVSAHPLKDAVRDDVDLRLHYRFHTLFSVEGTEYECPGCQRVLELPNKQAQKRLLRFCEFTGHHFCTDCHVNDERTLPASVVKKWDFAPSKVCALARDFLDDLRDKPCIDLREVSDAVKSNPTLRKLLHYRHVISVQKEFLLTCREDSVGELLALPGQHMFLLASEPHMFSLQTLELSQKGPFLHKLKSIAEAYAKHISADCPRCMGKGSFCEALTDHTCHIGSEQLIFPFQLETTTQCPNCHALYHKQCFRGSKFCPRCYRRAKHAHT